MLALPSTASAATVVSLTFDDGRASQFAAANALNARGFDGTFYINSAAIGGGGSLSVAQLHTIADAGHEIGSHGVYHIDLPANDADEQRRQLCDDRNWLLDQGFEVTSYAYPYSSYAGTAQQSAAACGFTSARAGWELNIGGNCGQTCAESIPPRNRWAVRTFKPVDVETTVADLQAQVLNALNHGGGWVPIMFHDICSNCGFYAMSTADLNAFLDWLTTQPVEVRTVRDVMGVTTVGPPVQSPAPAPRNPANLLQNPGMETIGAGWVLPFQIPARCWQQDGAWSVEAEWDRVSSDAHSGSWSMMIDLPSNDPVGYHELVASPDLGGCAVPGSAGHRFRFTGWYRSEGQVSVVQRVRQGPWSWQSATIAATLPPAAGWTQFSVDLPALSGNATAMVPGIRIRSAGTLFLDDLGLTEIGGGGPATQTLTVSKAGNGTGTVTSSPGGISCGSDCSEDFTQGTSVTLSQSPVGGSTFAGWSGACSGTGGCTVTMDQARSVTATFTAPTPTQTLSVTKSGSGTGTVTSSPGGINCGSDCTEAFDQGTNVTLSQAVGTDSVFAGWSGACSGTGACTVTMDQARTVTATFNRTAKTLTVGLGSTGSGSVSSTPAGISCGSDCSEAFAHGASVTLTATPAPNNSFTGWGGACAGTALSCTVTMSQDRGVTASFAPVQRQLTVARQLTSGATGTVTSSPAGIDCPTTCTASFPHGTAVTLQPAPGVDSVFTGWSGACSGAGGCTATMDQARSVTASFARTDKVLTVTRAGTGSGTVTGTGINCGTDCTQTVVHGTSVTLTASPAAGSTFAGWGGACSGTGSCTVTLTADLEVSASFAGMPREISVALIGEGLGTVTSNPAGISCGATCAVSFPVNTSVTLTAAVGADSSFAGWSGVCAARGTQPTCTINVAVNGSYAVGARFDRLPKALTVTRAGNGTGNVTSSPGPISCGTTCTATFPFGEVVTLTAAPGANVVLAGWGGACSGSGACTVTMDATRAVTARFEPAPRALDVAVTGGGAVTSAPDGISCPSACAASFGHGTDVTLSAAPSPGSSFAGWGGACSGMASTCTISLTAARSVTAEFTPLKHVLTVSLSGAGSGSVTGSAGGIQCPAACIAMLDHGAAVTLTPVAAAGSVFAGWSGACSGTGACTVTLDADRTATARFEPARQRLSLAFNGSGRVASKPAGLDCRRDCQREFAYGTSVRLTPVADRGWRLLGWRGACAGAKGACTLSMTQARSTTAVFVRAGGVSLTPAGRQSVVETASAKRDRPRR